MSAVCVAAGGSVAGGEDGAKFPRLPQEGFDLFAGNGADAAGELQPIHGFVRLLDDHGQFGHEFRPRAGTGRRPVVGPDGRGSIHELICRPPSTWEGPQSPAEREDGDAKRLTPGFELLAAHHRTALHGPCRRASGHSGGQINQI